MNAFEIAIFALGAVIAAGGLVLAWDGVHGARTYVPACPRARWLYGGALAQALACLLIGAALMLEALAEPGFWLYVALLWSGVAFWLLGAWCLKRGPA